MDTQAIGRALQTPLGLVSVLNVVLWTICLIRSYRFKYNVPRTLQCGWMVLYSLTLVIAYLTPTDRDDLRLFVAFVVGAATILAWMLMFEMQNPDKGRF